MANEGAPANPSLNGAQILAKLLALGALGAAFTDSAFAITGSSDATKIARFEVDGLTTATTRVYTLPDASITVAGINLAQTWTAAQVLDLGSGANPATALSGTVLSLLNADATNVRLLGVAYGANGIIISGRGVGGTRASPTATTNGQVLCQFTGFGYNGTTYPTSSSALYAISAGSLWTASNQETLHEWRCTANGSTTNTQRMVLYGTGNLCLGSAPADDGTNNLQVAGSAKLGSASVTGAVTCSYLTMSGFNNVAHTFCAGGVNGTLIVHGTGSTYDFAVQDTAGTARIGIPTGTPDVAIPSASPATSKLTGALRVGGGAGFVGNIIGGMGLGVGVASTASAGSTSSLTTASAAVQVVTGSSTHGFTLPAANAFGAGVAVVFMFKNRSSGNVTITRAGSDTIDGATTATLAGGLNSAVMLVSDGVSAWENI